MQSNGDPSGCYSLISSVAVLFTFFIKVKKIHVLMQKVKKKRKIIYRTRTTLATQAMMTTWETKGHQIKQAATTKQLHIMGSPK